MPANRTVPEEQQDGSWLARITMRGRNREKKGLRKGTHLIRCTSEAESGPGSRRKKISAVFWRSVTAGNEPVRDLLKSLSKADRTRVGEDLKTVEFGWPVGMPTCRHMGDGLHEV